jgi:formate-dependent nitrite reductase membrane component NrfD
MECETYMGYLSIVLGLYVLVCTLTKPKFFWESKKAKRLRKSIGESNAAIVYYIIASVALLVGLLNRLGIINF